MNVLQPTTGAYSASAVVSETALSFLYDATPRGWGWSRYGAWSGSIQSAKKLLYPRYATGNWQLAAVACAGLAAFVYTCYRNRNHDQANWRGGRQVVEKVRNYGNAVWSRGIYPALHFVWSYLWSDKMKYRYRTWLGVSIAVWYLQYIIRKEPDIVIDLTVNQVDKYFVAGGTPP